MKTLLFFFFLFSLLKGLSQTITTSAPLQTSLCAGGNIVVEYQTTGTFSFGCTFTAQLSDAWGNFNTPVDIGSVPINTGIIMGTIPINTTFGINYRVRVVSDNPVVIGTESPNPPIVIASSAVSATIITNPGTEICDGDSVNLWVTPNASYYWSTGETTQSINVTVSNTYNVTVTNYITGCEVSSTPVTIIVDTLPVIDIGSDTSFCAGNSTILDAGSGFASYSWNNGLSNSQTLQVNSTGTWFVSVTDDKGCSNSDTINIVVNPNPVVNLGSDTIFCGTHIFLNAGNGFSYYNWNNGLSFNPVLDVVQTGNYFVIVTDQNQCTASDTVNVSVNQPPLINLGNDLIVCGNSAILNAGSGFVAYNWNNGLGLEQFLPVIQSGTYTINITSANGCHGYDTINVNLYQLPDVNLGSDINLLTTDSIILDAGNGYVNYSWSNGSASQTIQINGWDYSSGIYTFSVTVIDSVGCFNTDQINITVINSSGIKENNFGKISVYPNPFSKTFIVYFDKMLPDGVPVLIDVTGRKFVPLSEKTNNGWKINCPDIPSGIYTLIIGNSFSSIPCGRVIAR